MIMYQRVEGRGEERKGGEAGEGNEDFRNEATGASRISQSLVGLLLGTRRQAGRHFVPSNDPKSDCE